jgi:hypothetical protein
MNFAYELLLSEQTPKIVNNLSLLIKKCLNFLSQKYSMTKNLHILQYINRLF